MLIGRQFHHLIVVLVCTILATKHVCEELESELESIKPDASNLGTFEGILYELEAHQADQPEPSLSLVERMLEQVPVLFGNPFTSNRKGTNWQYKKYMFLDRSNDEAIRMSLIELIERSGYEYELYDAVADDGYITRMTRLVNPLADRRYLRQPPVLLEHGGTIDPTCYLIASSIQHHPESWPRKMNDGHMTSSNRSLAFLLANHGFDVWLPETRGSSEDNERHIKSQSILTILAGENEAKNMTFGENVSQLLRQWSFWEFSQDDIIAHEFKSHIDKVMEVTGSPKVNLLTFSLSTPTSLAFLSIRPDYASKVHAYVSMAPIISGDGFNTIHKLVMQGICPLLPNSLGKIIVTDVILSDPVREFLLMLSKSRLIRYSVMKTLITLLLGPSAKYQTMLDENVLGHMLRQLSFKVSQQLCQQSITNKLQKFDYGPIRNVLIYNQTEPPVYDVSNIHVRTWAIVSGENDRLATLEIAERLKSLVKEPKLDRHIIAPDFNHMDLIAGVGNDKLVNMPIMEYLSQNSELPPMLDPIHDFHWPGNWRLSHVIRKNRQRRSEYDKTSTTPLEYTREFFTILRQQVQQIVADIGSDINVNETYVNGLLNQIDSIEAKVAAIHRN